MLGRSVAEGLSYVNLAWGRHGVQQAAARGDVIVIVDTLSFSSAVATAIEHGGAIYPCTPEDDAAAIAQQHCAVLAVSRRALPERGRYSLSPLTYVGMAAGTKVVLSSPNGATLCRLAIGAQVVIIGCLLNAQAVSAYLNRFWAKSAITVVAAGERYRQPTADGELRFALEDFLGAGAILGHLATGQSADAQVCAAAFDASRAQVVDHLWQCESGQELAAQGYGDDVRHSAQVSRYHKVPLLGPDGWIKEGWRYDPEQD